MDAVNRIARTVLYEGHVLFPYHRAAPKNRERWTFGRVYPEAHHAEGDASTLQMQALLEAQPGARMTLTLRFLQLVDRAVVHEGRAVDRLEVAGQRHVAWEEAAEREVVVEGVRAGDPPESRHFSIAPQCRTEPLKGTDGTVEGHLVWTSRTLDGVLTLRTDAVAPDVFRITALVTNTTHAATGARLLSATFLSTHFALSVENGRLVSLQDPPKALREAAAGCRNVGTWPVLVGEPGARHTMLAAPIVLYDYPEIAPESPGDFCDATEIDQLLVLNVLALTDEERRNMAASDPLARAIVERCMSLSLDDFLRLHGAIRGRRAVGDA